MTFGKNHHPHCDWCNKEIPNGWKKKGIKTLYTTCKRLWFCDKVCLKKYKFKKVLEMGDREIYLKLKESGQL